MSIDQDIRNCIGCNLAVSRKNAVPGEGNQKSILMFIGEGPGEEEDNTGRPFVGRAGELLDKILVSAGFQREEVYITNIVKCRPPNNRDPAKEEMDACWAFLLQQIEMIRPRVIATLGRISAQYLLSRDKFSITKEHGQIFCFSRETVLMPLYHPSYLLRNPSREKGSPKYQMWEDMKKLKCIFDSLKSETGESLDSN